MSTTQDTLNEYLNKSHTEKDCPACGETIHPTELPEHIRLDCEAVDREVHV